jgi:hypothetical protein
VKEKKKKRKEEEEKLKVKQRVGRCLGFKAR